jgi:hypothetical protein
VFGYYEYRLDLGLVNDLPVAKEYTSDTVWSVLEYMLSRNVSLMGSYDNHPGGGCLSDFKIHWHKFIYELDIQYRNNFQIMTACKMDLEMEEFGAYRRENRHYLTS